jgi:SAM-dependent methyltransferase
MSLAGRDFYDDDAVFATYLHHRQRQENPNDTLEQPIIRELLGKVADLSILDLGCGDARFGRELLDAGAAHYLGIDGSQNMITLAQQTLAGTSAQLIRHSIEDWSYPATAFDLVVARLVLHYIADLPSLFARVFDTLRPDGRVIFSVEHPVITSCDRAYPPGSMRQDWIVDTYFDTGVRVTTWLGGRVEKYHRTIEDYFLMLQGAGFRVEQLRESRPQRVHFQTEALYERRKRIPLFLFLMGRKPASEA